MNNGHDHQVMQDDAKRRIRVFVVDDSALARKILSDIINGAPGMHVVGCAANGKEALARVPALAPDIVCTDFHMPVMDGAQFIRQLMRLHPLPVLVVSVSTQENDKDKIFQLLQAGALDVIAKPRLHLNDTPQTLSKLKSELTSKIRILSGVYVFRRRSMAPGPELKVSSTHVLPVPTDSMPVPEIVVIGASTGGPQALKAIFTALQWPLPFPIVCVQHIAEGFHEGLLRWLGDEIGRPVEIAKAGQQPRAGVIYFAPENHHLAFDSYRSFIFSDSPPLAGSRPASDVLFNSAAARFGRGVLGIVLSGMGCDGASGLKQIADAGGMTVAQDEASCVVYGMPRAAIEIGAARYQLAPADIAQLINQIKVTT